MPSVKNRWILRNWRRWPDFVRAYLAHKLKPRVHFTEIDYDTTLRTWMHYHHDNIAMRSMRWMGVYIAKNPTDLWIYQELLWKIRPEVIVEIGSFAGGSTLYLAHLLDIIGQGEVISLDITRRYFQVSHPRISLVTGDSASPEIIARVKEMVGGRRAMVIHDANHEASAVLADLRAYGPLVTPGSYLIVEDGIVDTLKTEIAIRPLLGPMLAIEKFLAESPQFEIDRSCERYFITQNPSGFLKRIA